MESLSGDLSSIFINSIIKFIIYYLANQYMPIFMNFMRRARVTIDFFTRTEHVRLNIDQILLGVFRGSMGCGASEMDTAEFSYSRFAWLLQHEQLAELVAYLQLVG